MTTQYRVVECFYCGASVSRAWEFQRDHFPVPKAYGGTDLVVACVRCHHMKDRVADRELLEDVDAVLLSGPPEAVVAHDEVLKDYESNPTPERFTATLVGFWKSLAPPSRWYFARLLFGLHQQRSRKR